MTERLFGLETEYALVPAASHSLAGRRRFSQELVSRAGRAFPSLPDRGCRGVFLANGSRLYVDAGFHPELSTPEVANPWDAARYILAGERILTDVVNGAGNDTHAPLPVLLLKVNLDYCGATWGSHESFLHRIESPDRLQQIVPHLVTRIVYSGAGGFDPRSPGLAFTLSPRAAYLAQVASACSTANRGILHTRDEPLCRPPYGRFHVICGESLCSETALWLRMATTALVVSLVEGGVAPACETELASPLDALRAIAADPACACPVPLARGSTATAIDVQRCYLERVESHLGAGFLPPWTETACAHWRATLDRLEGAPGSVSTLLDWAIKRARFENHARRRGFEWDRVAAWTDALTTLQARAQAAGACRGPLTGEALAEPSERLRAEMRALRPSLLEKGLHWDDAGAFLVLRRELIEADMRFGQLGGEGIFAVLDRTGALTHHFPGVDNIPHAVHNPPAIGRGRLRGDLVRRLAADRDAFRCDWDQLIDVRDGRVLDLADPFEATEQWQEDPAVREATREADANEQRGLRPLCLRGDALDCYVRGEYARAEELLRSLLDSGFEVASTHCHLARTLLTTGRVDEARSHVADAWSRRVDPPDYVVGRTLWFLALFAFLDGADARPFLGQLKTFLERGVCLQWSMEPLLDSLHRHLPRDVHALLAALVDALGDGRQVAALDQFVPWHESEARPIGDRARQ